MHPPSIYLVDWSNPVNWQHPLNRGLQAWWLCVPGRAGFGSFTWRDLCRRHNGTLTNMTPTTAWQTSGQPGRWGRIAVNTNDYLAVNDSDGLSFGTGTSDSAFSITATIYLTDATGAVIASKDNWPTATQREWEFFINGSDQLEFNAFDQSAGAVIGRKYSAAMPENAWRHVAVAYSGSGAASGFRLYVDGVQVDDADVSAGSYTAMENLGRRVEIGARSSSSDYFDGYMDDVRIYRRRLSGSDVRELYHLSRQYQPGLLNRRRLAYGPQPLAASSNGAALLMQMIGM